MTIALALLDTAVNGISPRTFGRMNSDGKNQVTNLIGSLSIQVKTLEVCWWADGPQVKWYFRTTLMKILDAPRKGNHRGVRGRDFVLGITRICSGGRSYACLWWSPHRGKYVTQFTWTRKARTETGYEIHGSIGRPSWILCEKVALQFPGREVMISILMKKVAGATLRNGFSAAVMTPQPCKGSSETQ